MSKGDKKKILIGGGGTATAWHLSSLATTAPFSDFLELYIADTHAAHLVPASILSHRFLQVLSVSDPSYPVQMLTMLEENSIDIFVPLIDDDVYTFTSDNEDLKSLGVLSTSVCRASAALLADKQILSRHLNANGIATARIISRSDDLDMHMESNVFVKPRRGYGSRGAYRCCIAEAQALFGREDLLIQECLAQPEITVEVFNFNGEIKSLSRERIEVKAGVCTKARIWHDPALHALAIAIGEAIAMPVAYCFQVMKGTDQNWRVIDVNARLGAGTALSTCANWSLASAALSVWGQCDMDPFKYLIEPADDIFVGRVYREVVMGSGD
ncbi:MAG: hypothetical protein HOC23_10660 [Halieaceae bacterium]|jgi:carbamoyl-phosphate synthase large subunit|nr:hypothetical protein [Halieaceae bacterium]